MASAYEQILETEEGKIALAEEHAIAHVAELIASQLEKSGMTRKQLAEKLGVTPGRITQLLDGDANMTLATVARILHVFGQVFEVACRSMGDFSADFVWTGPLSFKISDGSYGIVKYNQHPSSPTLAGTIGNIPNFKQMVG